MNVLFALRPGPLHCWVKDYDIEVVEMHITRKKRARSGTANAWVES